MAARIKNWEDQERGLRERRAARRARGSPSPWRRMYENPMIGKGPGEKGWPRMRSTSRQRGKGRGPGKGPSRSRSQTQKSRSRSADVRFANRDGRAPSEIGPLPGHVNPAPSRSPHRMPATKSRSPSNQRSATPATSRTAFQPDANEQVQYPQMDPMKDLNWVTAPLAEAPAGGTPGQPKPGVKIIPIVKRKVQPPSTTAPLGPPAGKKGKGKSRSPSRKGKGRGGKSKNKGKRGTQHFFKSQNQSQARKDGASGAGARTVSVG